LQSKLKDLGVDRKQLPVYQMRKTELDTYSIGKDYAIKIQ
jgi:hypothetical protein